MLKVRNIVTAYGQIQALKGVSLEVNDGEVVSLIGANGAGKTTLLNTISAILRPRSGSIQFNGKELARARASEVAALGIVQAPEGRGVFGRMTVQENLLLGAHLRRDTDGINADLEHMYHRFPVLAERRDRLAGELSGGEQQMLALARALMARPKLLLLDEPSMGLAPIIVERVFAIIRQIRESGVTLLLVEQNARLALSVADRGYVLENGEVTMSGPARDLLESERIQEAYLGA